MKKFRCLIPTCDHEWYSRKTDGKKPVQCPKCKRTDYDVKPKKEKKA